MKKFSWFLMIVLLLGYISGCISTTENDVHSSEPTIVEEYGETLTQSQKEDILHAWSPKGDSLSFSGWLDDGTGFGRYYGAESGYAILFIPSATPIATNIVIGEYTFHHSSGFNVYAYRNGTFYKLAEAYYQGLISDAAIQVAWERHIEIEQQQDQNQS